MNIKFKNVHSVRYRSLAFILSLTVLLSGLVWYGVAQSNQKAEAVYPSRNIVYIDADFYDYYYDNQITQSVNTVDQGDDKEPYGIFNNAVSKYSSENGWQFPLYFGQFWIKDEVADTYSQTSARDQKGYGNTGLNNFKWSANLAFRPASTKTDDGENITPQFYTVASGLVDGGEYDDNGNLIPTCNGVRLPYFDEDFLSAKYDNYGNKSGSGKNIASVKSGQAYPFYASNQNVEVGVQNKGGSIVESFDTFGPGYRFDSKVNAVYFDDDGNLKESTSDHHVSDHDADAAQNGFFPFNSEDPGNKNGLNYGFGAKYTINFEMNENGTIDGESWSGINGGSEDNRAYFTFKGDDDVWVFIDDKLVLDMGGAHKDASGYIDFANQKVGVVYSADAQTYQYGIKKDVDGDVFPSKNVTKTFSELGIGSIGSDGEEHTLTMFYMERGMLNSNLFVQFNLPVDPHEDMLTITDKVSVEKVNKGLQSQTLAVADSDVVNYTVSNKGTKPSEVHDTGLLYPGSTVIRRYNTEYFSTHPTGGGTDHYEDYGQKVLLADGSGYAATTEQVLDEEHIYIDFSNVSSWWFNDAVTYVYTFGGTSSAKWTPLTNLYSCGSNMYRMDYDGRSFQNIIVARVNPSRTGDIPNSINWNPNGTFYNLTMDTPSTRISTKMSANVNCFRILDSKQNHNGFDKNQTSDGAPQYTTQITRPSNQSDKKYLNEFSSDFGFDSDSPHAVAETNYELVDPKAQRKNTGSTSGARPWLSYATSSTAEQTSSSGALNLMYDQSAVFTGQFTVGSKMQIKQSDTLYKPSVNSSTQLPTYNVTSRTLGDYYNISEPKLEYGSGTPGSNPTEAVPGTDGTDTFTFDDVNKDANDNKVNIEAIYTREVKTGSISIEKKLKNAGETSTDGFTMKVEMSSLLGTTESALGDVTDYSGVDIEDSSLSTKLDSDGTFKMKAGETVKIDGIPVGTVVKISEENAGKHFDLTKVNIQGNTTTGIAVDEEREVVITNTRSTGTMSFTKALGETAEGYEDKVFTLKIRFGGDFDGKVYNADKINLNDYTLQYYYSENNVAGTPQNLQLENVGGTAAPDLIYEAEFKIKVGQKINITGIPNGVRYCYKEEFTDGANLTSVNNNGTYTSSWSPTYKRGSKADNNPQAVRQFLATSTYTNDYTITNEQAVGSLKITKVLQGANGAEITDSTSRNTAFKAKVELQLPEGFDVNKQYFTVTDINRNNVKTKADRVDSGNNIAFFDITFSYNKPCTIGNIPFGTKWKVTETDIPSGWEYSKTEYRSTEQYKSFDFYTTGESTSGGGGSTSGGGGSTSGGGGEEINPPDENKLRNWYETEKGTLNRLIYNYKDDHDEIATEREIRITNKKAAYLTIEKYIDELYYGEKDNPHDFPAGSSGVTSPLNDNDPFGYLNYTSAEQDFVFKIEKYNLGTDPSESTSPISTSYVVLKFDKNSVRDENGYGIASTTFAGGSLLEPSGGAYKYKQSTTVKVDPGYLYKVSEVTTGISWRYKLTYWGIEATQGVDGYALVYSGRSEYVAVAYGLKADFSKIPVARFFNNRTTASQTIESDMSSVKNKLIIKQ